LDPRPPHYKSDVQPTAARRPVTDVNYMIYYLLNGIQGTVNGWMF